MNITAINRYLVIPAGAFFIFATSVCSYAAMTLTDGNSSISLDPASPAGAYTWSVDGQEQLFKHWFWYRVSDTTTDTPEHSVDTSSSSTNSIVSASPDDETGSADVGGSPDRVAPETEMTPGIFTPDMAEAPLPSEPKGLAVEPALFGAFASSAQQRHGALSGRIVFMNCGHGWIHDPSYWRLQRPVLNDMNEDYGNLDQLNFFAQYCFNAGATVVSMRPLGHQTNEVVLDNDSPGVSFIGSWANSTATYFYGSPGDVPYRYASFAATETATATYVPTLPLAGFYPVYAWTRNGSDRGDQLYRIRHTGGESLVRIPHHMVGNGWIYLGEYYFNAGFDSALGAVVISNLRETPTGSVVIADAIRFGNGMGSVDRGSGVSGYPREDESMRYWIQANLGQGQSASLYDGGNNDESDSWSAPPKMSAEMNRQEAGDIYDRIHISFHSNAGGGRGTVALITGDPTPNQAQLAEIMGGEVNDDLVALGSPPLEFPWFNKSGHTYSGGYSEIDGSLFNYEMPATIVEVAFHDDPTDAALMRDPKARAAVARAAMQGVIKFMNAYDTNGAPPLAFPPEPPYNLHAIAGTNGQITLGWFPPIASGGSHPPTNYVVYLSTNGFGFGNPVSVGNLYTHTVSNLAAGVDYYFRVTASNAGGESMPSETVGCRATTTINAPRVLVVNAFDRFDRFNNLRHSLVAQSYDPPGNSGTIERVYPRWNNAVDYVVAHGKAIAAAGWAFDSCQDEAVAGLQVPLGDYAMVIWACGNESTGDETFSLADQVRVQTYLAGGGGVLVSGTDVAYDLDRPSGPTAGDRSFLNNYLHATYGNDNAATYAAAPAVGGIFAARASAAFDNGNNGIYWVKTPDVLIPTGGATSALNYVGGTGGSAAVQYDGSSGGGRVVLLGFPFETITSSTLREQYMADVIAFLAQTPATNVPAAIAQHPLGQYVIIGSNATLSATAVGTPPLSYQWRFNGADLPGATSTNHLITSAQPADSGFYDVVVSNAFGMATSQVALVEVTLPPAFETGFLDNFDVNTSANWASNRSSTDTRVTFNYNHAPDGIPSAPNSTGGTTRAVKFEANMVNGVAAAVSISPLGQHFAGDHKLHFDMWMNANGPFPGGGTGSTEHFTAGIGTDGTRVQWTGAGSFADGHWFVVDGEGGSTDTTTTSVPDFGAFSGTGLFSAASGVYAAGTASDSRGNGHPYYTAQFPGQSAPVAQQVAYPLQQTGSMAGGTVGFAWREVLISRTGDTVEWFIDGLKVATIDNANFTGDNFFVGYWDSYNSLSDNAALSFGLVDNVRVEQLVSNVPPYLTTQPVGATVPPGANVLFSVSAGGKPTLTYQWRLNGTNVPGAQTSILSLTNVQTADSGDYSVAVSNTVGGVISADAMLSVSIPVPVEFTSILRQSNGNVDLVLSGDPGIYAIERSVTLTNWDFLAWVTNTSGIASYTDTTTTNGLQFYRGMRSP